jgi:hypothetical protein
LSIQEFIKFIKFHAAIKKQIKYIHARDVPSMHTPQISPPHAPAPPKAELMAGTSRAAQGDYTEAAAMV